MTPSRSTANEEWDSESEAGSDYSVTQTQLAVTDGPVEGDDGANPLVSKIGGHVAWLPIAKLPPKGVAECSQCHTQMELLVQIFAPLDDSPYDRIVLVWACARAACQKTGLGCVKAIRVLSHNARWAAKLEKKRQRQAERAAAKQKAEDERKAREEEEAKRKKVNPFASSGLATAGGPFAGAGGLGGALFGDAEKKESTKAENDHATDNSDSDDEGGDDEEMAEEMAVKASLKSKQTSWTESDWTRSVSSYEPAYYLTTFAEPSSSARAQDEQKRNKAEMQKLKQRGGVGDAKGFEAEQYENMMVTGVDEVFERFVKRVGQHPRQVVRYEFGGQPLAFHAQGKTYDKLWSHSSTSTTTDERTKTVVTGQAFSNGASERQSSGRTFTTRNVPRCARCGAERVCELQLMPNLINVLRPSMLTQGDDGDEREAVNASTKPVDAESARRRDIEDVLGHRLPTQPDADGITRDKIVETRTTTTKQSVGARERKTGIRWNTAIVLVCQADCHDDETKDGAQDWYEEVVELQFEQEASS